MKSEWVFAFGLLFTIALLYMSPAFAIEGAAKGNPVTNETNSSAPGNFSVTAGYINYANLTTSEQTYRWAGFYGTLSGSMVLRDSSGNDFYTWSTTGNTGSIVYATTNSSTISPDYFVAINASNGDLGATDTAYGFSSSVTDSISNTYDYYNTFTSPSSVSFVTNSTPLQGGIWTNYLMKMVSGTTQPSATTDLVWACEVNASKTAFNGVTADYELLIPENEEPDDGQYAPTFYYFWVELI